jgi:hypothetical protein
MVNLPTELVEALPDDAQLERMRYRADPLADQTVSRILGPWPSAPADVARQQQRMAVVSRLFMSWQDNQSLQDWWPGQPDLEPEVAQCLADYVREAQALPQWADVTQIQSAEALFMEHGVLSCLLLFCASLPECYVVPDLAAVLQSTSQLTSNTQSRIRATAAMVFPVMTEGGLTEPEGSGIAQILKVRLIHATVRYQVLHDSPQAILAAGPQAGLIPSATLGAHATMHQALAALGWDVNELGLPCNQEELAYTLLTFSYVFVRGLRQLGVSVSPHQADAYLHTWNVAGYILGVQRSLMADTMEEAALLFDRLQARGRVRPIQPDVRPALSRALIATMQDVLPKHGLLAPVLRPIPQQMTRYLCGPTTAQALGLRSRFAWVSNALFKGCLLAIRGWEAALDWVWPQTSALNGPWQKLGRQLMAQLLLDQTQPLQLPSSLRTRVQTVMDHWEKRRKYRPTAP